MKKLMIAAAIVCAAAFAQASTVTWGLTSDVYTKDSDDLNGKAYIIALASDSVAGLSINENGEVVLGEGMSIAQQSTVKSGVFKSTTSVVNANGYFALLVEDGDNHYWNTLVGQVTGITPDDDTDKKSLDFGEDDFYASNAPTPVPEPTSGLLLLLGVAGLALRRRRA